MLNPESVQGNERHKFLWDFDIHADPGQTTRHCNNQQEKRTCQIMDFAVLADNRVKLKESEKKRYVPRLCEGTDQQWNMKVTVIPIVIGALGTGKNTKYSFIKIGQNSEKRPGDLSKLAVTQIPERNYQLTLVWKTLKRVITKVKQNWKL